MLKLIFIIYTLAMLATSLIPMGSSSSGPAFLTDMNPGLQNVLHIPMFAGFVLLLFLLGHTGRAVAGWKRLWLVLLAIAYGIGLELLQIAVPGRYASFLDIILNSVGVGIGLGIWCAILIKANE